jgi:outer membrane beta-barrel protein
MKTALLLVLVASTALAENVVSGTVEPRPSAYAGKFELLAFPMQVQVNGTFTQHVGGGLGFGWHPQENFGLQLSGFYNALAQESDFNGELIEKVRTEAQSSTTLLVEWGTLLTAELSPFHGKFALGEDLVHFSVLFSGGGGLGGTKHQLKPMNESGPATYGNTGVRPMGALGAGVRLQYGKRFSVRLEVRDLVYMSGVSSVNGCNRDELRRMDAAFRGGALGELNPSCSFENFSGRPNDVALANNLTKDTSNGLLHLVGLQLGVGFLF